MCMWVALKENAKLRKDIVDYYKSMSASRISGGAMETLPEAEGPGNPETNTISSWSYVMEGHAKK